MRPLTSQRLKVILPLLSVGETVALEKVFSLKFFRAGMRDLVVCFLENQEDPEYFVHACWYKVEQEMEELDTESQAAMRRLLFDKIAYCDAVSLGFSHFFKTYQGVVRSVVGEGTIDFVRVISYRTNQGICVEIDYEPPTPLPYR